MPGRGWTSSNGYRYGFNGKESDYEIKNSGGTSYDYGARMYDSRLGRWLSVDKLADKYADMSPYNFALNTPIQAKDPDGKVVIFVNGMHTGNGGTSAYWGGFDRRAMNRIGDHSARYVDGALGGSKNTSAWAKLGFNIGGPVGAIITLLTSSNVSLATRIAAGEAQGYADAADILWNLTPGETIKIVTHSMGSGFGAGYEAGIQKYILDHPELDLLKHFTFSLRVEASPFQGASIPAPANSTPSVCIVGGVDGGGKNILKTDIGNSVPTVAPVAGEQNGTVDSDSNKGHAISELSTDKIPYVGGAGTESQRPIEQGSNNTNAPN
jgi:RHS repeat-associated protein